MKGGGFVKLKHLRTLRGVTQNEVSLAIGCSSVVYNRYENGEREPSIEMLIKLADFFEVSVDMLLGHDEKGSELLNDYETNLVQAARRADQRARDDALGMLVAHEQARKREGLA